jgi:hypothetical protein
MNADPRQQAIWESTQQTLEQALGGGMCTVLKTYPNGGKTTGFGAAVRALGEDGTILQPNRDLRDATAETNEEMHGLANLDLPSFFEECRLADEDDPAYDERAVEWRRRGMPPRAILDRLGKPEDDPYCAKMSLEWSNYEAHTGDPAHMFLGRAVEDRHVAIDDVDAYGAFVEEHDLQEQSTQQEVLEYLRLHSDELPEPVSLGTVLSPSPEMAAAMTDVASAHPSELDVPDTVRVTSETDAVVRALARQGEEAVWAEPGPDGHQVRHVAVKVNYDGQTHVVHMNLPTHLRDARSITMMTATPVYPIFRRVFEDLGVASQVVDSIPNGMKEEYFDEIIGTDVVQTTGKLNPVSGCNGVRPDDFRALVEEVEEVHGQKPLVISSKKALEAGEEAVDSENEPYRRGGEDPRDGLADAIDEYGLDSVNFARAVGTNEFGDRELAIIWGSPHFGDGFVKRAAAICGDTGAVPVRWESEGGEPLREHEPGASRVETRWSTETAQEIYENMTEGSVLQALMRVGRSSDAEATVYCHTSAVPRDVPAWRPAEGEAVRRLNGGEREVARTILDEFGTGEGVTARDVTRLAGCSRATVYRAVSGLVDAGVLEPAGTGDWGAEKYALMFEEAAELGSVVPDSVSDALMRAYMEKRDNFVYCEPEYDDRVGELTSRGGSEPAQLSPQAPTRTATRYKRNDEGEVVYREVDDYVGGEAVTRHEPVTEEVEVDAPVQQTFGEPSAAPDRGGDDGPAPGEQDDITRWLG